MYTIALRTLRSEMVLQQLCINGQRAVYVCVVQYDLRGLAWGSRTCWGVGDVCLDTCDGLNVPDWSASVLKALHAVIGDWARQGR